jgi:inner membrane protein
LFLPILLYIYLLFFATFEIAIAVFLGYVSHLVLDALTKEGIYLFWPLPYRIKGFMHTNSLLEKGLFVAIVLIIFLISI